MIDFGAERWQKIEADYTSWWNGELDRPIIQFVVGGRDSGRPEPSIPYHSFTAFYDMSISADAVVDRWDYELSSRKYLGDAFPYEWLNFGPGVIAAFLGAKLECGADTVWYHPEDEKDISQIDWQFNPDNDWYRRVIDICEAANRRWEGSVQIGTTDLGGNLDILSTFRPSEKLLFDLYDNPEDVKRLTWRAHELWWQYFEEINKVLRPTNPGYTSWCPMFSSVPFYILQCDFSYMIGPDMFDEFAKPELEASCKRLGNAFYHLDGPGELPHLDSLLAIPELKGIQWVPGAGAPDYKHWPEVYRKIRDAGKMIQVYGEPDVIDALAEQLGSAKGIMFMGYAKNEQEALDCLSKYGSVRYC